MKPASDRALLTNGTGLSGQNQEGGLKNVLGIMDVPQHSTTNAQHQLAVPPKQRREGRLVAPESELLQQLLVELAVFTGRFEDLADVLEDGARL